MTSRNILTRVAKAEETIGGNDEAGGIRLYFTEGPTGMDARAFLEGLGYDLPANARIVHFVQGVDGRPAHIPPADLTPRFAPHNALAGSR